jgi:hypothetical protein
MKTWITRFAWMAAGIAGLYALSALAGVASGGSLDPPGAPASTMQSLADIAPSWHQKLLANDGDGAGCGSQRFACVLGSTAVLDRESGIVWQRTPSAVAVNWETAEQSCLNLATDGRTGWRLPTVHELRSLTEPGAINPSLPTGHPFTVSINTKWTSTQSSVSPGETLAVTLTTGAVTSRPRGDFLTATPWCVRAPGGVEDGGAAIEPAPPPWSQILSAAQGGNSCESPRFRCVMNTEAVLDRETGLVWQRTPSVSQDHWYDALDACTDTEIGGRYGWRLPSLVEFMSLLDNSADSLPDGHPFNGATGAEDTYFTDSTSYLLDGTDRARVVDVSSRSDSTRDKTDIAQTERTWCVRGGSEFQGGHLAPPP